MAAYSADVVEDELLSAAADDDGDECRIMVVICGNVVPISLPWSGQISE